jgi:hypothetical protein
MAITASRSSAYFSREREGYLKMRGGSEMPRTGRPVAEG